MAPLTSALSDRREKVEVIAKRNRLLSSLALLGNIGDVNSLVLVDLFLDV